jgi:hypothetical protein
MGRQFMAVGHELTHHDFAIDEVLGAAQTYKTDFQMSIPTGVLLSG